MRHTNRSLPLLVLVLAVAFSGCRSTHASPTGASPAKRSAAASSAQILTHPSKHSARDSELGVYHNPDYSISFRYPRNYALEEAPDSENPAFLRYQQDLAATQPGAILVAAVLIPEDAYPNTTFRSGSLQFVVHLGVTPEACQSYATPLDLDSPGTAGGVNIHGIPFDWRLRGSSAAETYLENVDYAGFSAGTCYEFLIELAESNADEPDSAVKPADLSKILRPLEKTVASFQLEPSPAVARR